MAQILAMKLEHMDQVFEIEKNSFSIPWTRESLEKELTENKISIYIVVEEEGEILGYAGMWHVVTEGHITNIAIKEEERGKGYGKLLLAGLINIAKEKEMMGVTLEVRVGNEKAMKMYSSHGFKIEGIRKNYYEDTKEDAVVMWKYL